MDRQKDIMPLARTQDIMLHRIAACQVKIENKTHFAMLVLLV